MYSFLSYGTGICHYALYITFKKLTIPSYIYKYIFKNSGRDKLDGTVEDSSTS